MMTVDPEVFEMLQLLHEHNKLLAAQVSSLLGRVFELELDVIRLMEQSKCPAKTNESSL